MNLPCPLCRESKVVPRTGTRVIASPLANRWEPCPFCKGVGIVPADSLSHGDATGNLDFLYEARRYLTYVEENMVRICAATVEPDYVRELLQRYTYLANDVYFEPEAVQARRRTTALLHRFVRQVRPDNLKTALQMLADPALRGRPVTRAYAAQVRHEAGDGSALGHKTPSPIGSAQKRGGHVPGFGDHDGHDEAHAHPHSFGERIADLWNRWRHN